jgi:transposase-like protein
LEKPTVIHADKAQTYAAALGELKKEGKCLEETWHRQVKYLKNVIEADHGKLKLLIRPVGGFKTLRTAYATIKGFVVMRALRKGQASGDARIVERPFGIGASAVAEGRPARQRED